MTTEIVPVNEDYFENKVFELGKIIREGGLVSFPTETVYGLGANALDAEAAIKTYAAKGRPSDNPLIVHVADKGEVSRYVKEVTPLEEKLMDAFWPGPLTIVFPKKDIIPKETSGGLDTIAIRCPANEATRALIRAAGVPISGPSANISTRPSPTTAKDVYHDMHGRIEAIIDDGPCRIGAAICLPGDIVIGTKNGILFVPSHMVDYVIEHAYKSQVRDLYAFPKLEAGIYTTADVDAVVWNDQMMQALLNFIDTDPAAAKYRGLDWSVELRAAAGDEAAIDELYQQFDIERYGAPGQKKEVLI